ncbi:MAG: aminoacyl-tRNA hydrolase [Candidatus Babeliales bacterium]
MQKDDIKAIIGLGNPGEKHYNNRHNIGFRILDALAEAHTAYWQEKDNMLTAEVQHGNRKVILVKPQTFMNSSSKVLPFLLKKGIKPENILVVHDELELALGVIKIKFGGSAKGHNGLRSIIEVIGKEFYRLCFGIGRPKNKEEVSEYVLSNFQEDPAELEFQIGKAVTKIGELFDSEK